MKLVYKRETSRRYDKVELSICLCNTKKEAVENHTVDFLTASFYENGRRKICIYYTIFCEKRYPFFWKKLKIFNFFCKYIKERLILRKKKEFLTFVDKNNYYVIAKIKKGVAYNGNLWYKFLRTKEFKFVSLCCSVERAM